MAPPAVLGLDLGTSRVKALVCAADGTVLGRGTVGYQVTAPRPGWAETDPEHWWQATRTAVRSAVGPASAQVSALAIVGQMHGLVLYSERTGVLRPAVVWLDRRATAEAADYLRLPEHLRARLGNAPSPGMAGPVLLWLSRHEPEAYRQARWMLQPKDWLRLRLTGEPATDPTDASGTLLYDLDDGAWAAGVAGALGLRTDLLPPIRPPSQVAGSLLPAAAEQLGLPPGLPVATGAADTAASLLAAGLPGGNWGLLTLGTGGQWVVPGGGAPDLSGATNLFRAVDGQTYRLGGAQNVGVALDWVRRTLGATWDELYRTAERPWQQDTPVFLPYLAGERGSASSGGAWTGLILAHQRDDLMRAALEGVAFLLRGKLDQLRAAGGPAGLAARGGDPEHVLLAGGGGQHPAWRQLLADVLGVPLHPVPDGWLTARGAAMLAAVMTGGSTEARSEKSSQAVRPGASAVLAEAGYRRFRSSALPPDVWCYSVSNGDHLKRAIYARLEEMSFRSGAAAAGGVVAVGGLAIALAVLPSGHRPEAAAPRAVTNSTTPASVPPATAPPSSRTAPSSRAARSAAAAPPAAEPAAAAPAQSSPSSSQAASAPPSSPSPATPTPRPSRPGPYPTRTPSWNPWSPWNPWQPWDPWGWQRHR
jgi:xylulokinase